MKMDTKGGPPPPTPYRLRGPAARPPRQPAGRLTSSVLTEGRRPQLWPPPPASRPSLDRRALLYPLSFLGPGSGLCSRLSGQPRAWAGSGHGLPPGPRREAGREGKAVASAASSWLCHEGERGQAGRLPGQGWGERERSAERRGAEGAGAARPAPPGLAALGARCSRGPSPPAGRLSPGELPLPRPGSKRLTHVRGAGGQARPRPTSGTMPGPCAGTRGTRRD